MKKQLTEQIISFMRNCPDNRDADTGARFFDDPVIRFADAGDPLFDEYKTLIGDFHNTPKEAYESAFGAGTFGSGSVISIMLPLASKVRESNRKQTEWASKEWAIARAHSDAIFAVIAGHTCSVLEKNGARGIAPGLSEGYKVISDGINFASTWSERHIAYACGHGTFSLNQGFITEKGIAGRFVSVVTDFAAEADERTAKDYTANCLYYAKGICGVCIKRCPVGAITEQGHDKRICYRRCYGEESRNLAVAYGGSAKSGAGCGLCQTATPCEFRNPVQ